MQEKLRPSLEEQAKLQSQFRRSFWIMQGTFLPLVSSGLFVAIQKNYFTPEEKSFWAIVLGTQAACSLGGVVYFSKTGLRLLENQEKIQKQKSKLIEGIKFLAEDPTEDDKKEYLKLRADIPLYLADSASEKKDFKALSVDSIKENKRITAVKTLFNELVTTEKRKRMGSDLQRCRILNYLSVRVFNREVTSQRGLPLLQEEKTFILQIFHWLFKNEKAPEVTCSLASNFAKVLESFLKADRLKQSAVPSHEIFLNQDLQKAIWTEKFTGVLVDIPLGSFREAEELKQKQESRVLITYKEAVDAARQLVALCFRVQPEVRDKARGEIRRIKETFSPFDTPNIRKIMEILNLSDRSFTITKDNFFGLEEIKPKVKGNLVEISDFSLSRVDAKACQIALTYPLFQRIKIVITATNKLPASPATAEKFVSLPAGRQVCCLPPESGFSASQNKVKYVEMEEFYQKRLIENRKDFLEKIFAKQENLGENGQDEPWGYLSC